MRDGEGDCIGAFGELGGRKKFVFELHLLKKRRLTFREDFERPSFTRIRLAGLDEVFCATSFVWRLGCGLVLRSYLGG